MRKFVVGSLVPVLLVGSLGISHAQDRLTVVASFSILADVVSRVAGDSAEVTSLMPLNADPHTFLPSPQDLVRISEADVVFITGAGFEGGLLESIENAGEDIHIVAASKCVNILPFGDEAKPGEDSLAHESDPSCEAHHQELGELSAEEHAEGLGLLYELDCGDHHEEDTEHEHAEGSCDPHVWMNPRNVMLWTLLIRDTLSQLDPANAEQYAAKAAAYMEELRALDADIRGQVESLPEEKRVLVTNHETLGYFADAYGFEIVGTIITGGGSSEISAADLAKLIDLVNQTGVTAIFTENTLSSNIAEQVSSETGVQVLQLYTDSLSEDTPTYLDYMRYNTQTIVDGLNP